MFCDGTELEEALAKDTLKQDPLKENKMLSCLGSIYRCFFENITRIINIKPGLTIYTNTALHEWL